MKIVIFLLLACLLTCQQQDPPQASFSAQSRKQRNFINEEQKRFRLVIEETNKERIQKNNKNQTITYESNQNQFIDLTPSQFEETYFGLIPTTRQSRRYARILASDDPRLQDPGGPVTLSPSQKQQLLQVVSSAGQVISKRRGIPKQFIIDNFLPQTIEKPSTKSNNETEEPIETPNPRLLQQRNFNIDWSCITGSAKQQGKCGSCYAFAPLQMVSSYIAIYYSGIYFQLSAQQILDCQNNGLTFGCFGGYMEGTYTYIKNQGISAEFAYPYQFQTNFKKKKCESKRVLQGYRFKIKDFILGKGCFLLKFRLRFYPISAGIAVNYDYQFYSKDVFNGCVKDAEINHAVLVVGYRKGYGWKIKNSWGKKWGQKGYGWISEENNCGICNSFSFINGMKEFNYDLLQQKVDCSVSDVF